MGRKPNTDQRRAQIIEALLGELAAVGYERASIRSVAARAGLTPGLVHYHFHNKEEILLALVDGLIAEAEAGFAPVLEGAAAPARKLAAYVSSRVGLGPSSDNEQVRAWVGVIAETMGQTKVRSRVARWLAKDHVQLAVLFKEAGCVAVDEHAAALLAMILGSFSLHAIKVSGIPRGYAEPELLRWLDAVLPAR
ncbi:MAG TPA: TetR/AcrR family transcriptional regulator [Nevskia sp.]|jgi:TetR/AcrR family transcriptional repressor of bet genes|nr:TetR/AcrR family transcriptional regulator [Nevskia sp.]